jgi:hypothetical protein
MILRTERRIPQFRWQARSPNFEKTQVLSVVIKMTAYRLEESISMTDKGRFLSTSRLLEELMLRLTLENKAEHTDSSDWQC